MFSCCFCDHHTALQSGTGSVLQPRHFCEESLSNSRSRHTQKSAGSSCIQGTTQRDPAPCDGASCAAPIASSLTPDRATRALHIALTSLSMTVFPMIDTFLCLRDCAVLSGPQPSLRWRAQASCQAKTVQPYVNGQATQHVDSVRVQSNASNVMSVFCGRAS